MSTLRHTIHIHFGYGDDDPKPKGAMPTPTLASLDLGDSISLLGGVTLTSAVWLRKLATEAENLADAIEARLAEQTKPEPTCYCDADLVAPHPFSECPHRMAESTTGETRDVPTPGAAT